MKGERGVMTSLIKQTGKSKSLPESMLISAVISISVTVIGSLAIANGLQQEKISWEQAGYWIMAMLFLASFLSATSTILFTKRKRLAIACMSGLLYWGLLLCLTALCWGGQLAGIWETAAIIGAGACSAGLLSPINRKTGHRRKRGYNR